MNSIKIDNIALERIIMRDFRVKIKYLIKELENLKVSEETLKTLRYRHKYV